MKFKAMLLVVCAVSGVGASLALADNGNGQGDGHGDQGKSCRAQHISGTVGPQTFTITVTKADRHGSIAPGSTVTVTIGGTGETVRANVGGCTTSNGTTTTSTLTVRSVDLEANSVEPGEHHGTTTTTATTTTTHS
ncbi:MAG TPA: hypothetical protein VGN06_09585 [Gaiellaceae bacterium]|jgi:hypothetical protein